MWTEINVGSADLLLNTDILTPSVVNIHTYSSTAFSLELSVLSLLIKVNPSKLTDLSVPISFNHVSVKHIRELSLYSKANFERDDSSSRLFLSDLTFSIMILGTGTLCFLLLILVRTPDFLPLFLAICGFIGISKLSTRSV